MNGKLFIKRYAMKTDSRSRLNAKRIIAKTNSWLRFADGRRSFVLESIAGKLGWPQS